MKIAELMSKDVFRRFVAKVNGKVIQDLEILGNSKGNVFKR